MNNNDRPQSEEIGEMSVRRTTMPDVMYLIYFEFGEPVSPGETKNGDTIKSDDTDV